MKKLPLSVSPASLFCQANQKVSKHSAAVPANWETIGFQKQHVYLRPLVDEEKKHVRIKHSGSPFDWDKTWYGVFLVRSGILLAVADSRKLLRTQVSATRAIEIYLN